MKKSLKVLLAYTHDFASAMWFAALLVIFLVNRTSFPSGTELFFFQLKKQFFYIGIVCLVVLLMTGAGRTLLYKRGAYGEEAEYSRKWILIVKHILGFVVYGAGTYWQYVMVFCTGNN
jgi:putative copper export protein